MQVYPKKLKLIYIFSGWGRTFAWTWTGFYFL